MPGTFVFMSVAAKITAGVAAAAVAGFVALALPACTSAGEAAPTATPARPAAEESPSATATAAPETPLTELPASALESIPWIVYPDGFECVGTEGCPNDYRAAFGEPGDPLPEHVEIYDPAVHDGVLVFPANQ